MASVTRAAAILTRLFDPRRGALIFIAKTTLASWCFVGVFILLEMALSISFGLVSTDDWERESDKGLPSILWFVVIPPVFENILLAFLIEFSLAFTSSRYVVVWSLALVFGVLHCFQIPNRFVAGFLGFAVMGYSYFLWYSSGFIKRYTITVAQHVLFNAMTFTLLYILMRMN